VIQPVGFHVAAEVELALLPDAERVRFGFPEAARVAGPQEHDPAEALLLCGAEALPADYDLAAGCRVHYCHGLAAQAWSADSPDGFAPAGYSDHCPVADPAFRAADLPLRTVQAEPDLLWTGDEEHSGPAGFRDH
jgi:hypothetical protein